MVKIFACISACALVVGGFYYFGRDTPTDEVWWENERLKTDLHHQIEITRLRVDRREKEPETRNIEDAVAELESSTARFDKLFASYQTLIKETSAVEASFLSFREERSAKLRKLAVGKEWPEFIAASGRKLKNVTVVTVDDAGVMLRHEDGSARMRYEDLTEDQRCLFGLEEESAIAAMREEQQRAREYEEWAGRESEAAKIREIARQDDQKWALSQAKRKPLPKAKRLVSSAPLPELASNEESPLKIKSLSDPARKVNANPRYRVRSYSRTTYYYYSAPRQNAYLERGPY